MATEWKEWNGSDEQIAEMLTTKTGFIVDSQLSVFKDKTILNMPVTETNITWLKDLLNDYNVKEYLICNPHKYADMMLQWALTGQPVCARAFGGIGSQLCHEYFPPFAHPDKFEYSFTEFEEEV